ncbi:hypothetical protein ES702_03132 [subsurface metagenome]
MVVTVQRRRGEDEKVESSRTQKRGQLDKQSSFTQIGQTLRRG